MVKKRGTYARLTDDLRIPISASDWLSCLTPLGASKASSMVQGSAEVFRLVHVNLNTFKVAYV